MNFIVYHNLKVAMLTADSFWAFNGIGKVSFRRLVVSDVDLMVCKLWFNGPNGLQYYSNYYNGCLLC